MQNAPLIVGNPARPPLASEPALTTHCKAHHLAQTHPLSSICQAGRLSHLSLPCPHTAEPTNGRSTLPDRKSAGQAASQTCTLVAGISLRALVPVANADALTIGIRLLDRLNEYNQYAPYWTVRPQVGAPVVLLNTAFTWSCQLLTRPEPSALVCVALCVLLSGTCCRATIGLQVGPEIVDTKGCHVRQGSLCDGTQHNTGSWGLDSTPAWAPLPEAEYVSSCDSAQQDAGQRVSKPRAAT